MKFVLKSYRGIWLLYLNGVIVKTTPFFAEVISTTKKLRQEVK